MVENEAHLLFTCSTTHLIWKKWFNLFGISSTLPFLAMFSWLTRQLLANRMECNCLSYLATKKCSALWRKEFWDRANNGKKSYSRFGLGWRSTIKISNTRLCNGKWIQLYPCHLHDIVLGSNKSVAVDFVCVVNAFFKLGYRFRIFLYAGNIV